jgi:hypothetical protein
MSQKVDLALIKTVLIRVNSQYLDVVYEKLYQVSNRYILVCGYYNTTPVAIGCHGNADRFFKRDVAGEMLDNTLFGANRLWLCLSSYSPYNR